MKRFVLTGCAVMVLSAMLFGQTEEISLSKVDAPTESGRTIMAAVGILIETYQNGKLAPTKLIGEYLFARDKGGMWGGYWQHIQMTPVDNDKSVCLRMVRASSDDGEIANIQSFPNGCSFDLVERSFARRAALQVIVKEDGVKRTVQASGLWYDTTRETELKMEWKSTDKPYFELPYKKVF